MQEWSPAAADATGIDRARAVGSNACDVLAPSRDVSAAIADALAGRVTEGLEVWLEESSGADATKCGGSVRLLLQVAPASASDGGGVVFCGQNVSSIGDPKKLAEAVAANEAKSKFLASVSRELRTPLSVIMGMNDLLLETSLEMEQRTLAEQVRASADALLALLDDVNDLTTIEAGKLEQSLVDFDARTILEDAIDVVSIDAITKGLEISGYMDAKLPTRVHGDADHLRQILVNLLANAIKYTSTGGVYVKVEVDKESERELTYVASNVPHYAMLCHSVPLYAMTCRQARVRA